MPDVISSGWFAIVSGPDEPNRLEGSWRSRSRTVRLSIFRGAMLRSVWTFQPRQPRDPEHRPSAGLGGDFNAVSEEGCQAVHDSQSDPKALDGPVALLVASVKLAEDVAELARRNADA